VRGDLILRYSIRLWTVCRTSSAVVEIAFRLYTTLTMHGWVIPKDQGIVFLRTFGRRQSHKRSAEEPSLPRLVSASGFTKPARIACRTTRWSMKGWRPCDWQYCGSDNKAANGLLSPFISWPAKPSLTRSEMVWSSLDERPAMVDTVKRCIRRPEENERRIQTY
jgi:hypothetical protein